MSPDARKRTLPVHGIPASPSAKPAAILACMWNDSVLSLTAQKEECNTRSVACVIALTLAAAACTERPRADPSNVEQVARGKRVYETQCAACHGAQLEGQPNWRERLPSGKFPAPPHDPSGHTWHHSDELLFNITKHDIERYAPPGYRSDMPAFANQLSDNDIWAVLAYIKSTWPDDTRKLQAEISREDSRARR